jgi:hypothetical protein
MIASSIHFPADDKISFFFMAQQYFAFSVYNVIFSVSIHQLMGILAVSTVWLL